MSTLKYLGHASLEFITNEGIVIYVDPYAGKYEEKADLILVTHEHYDHNKVDKVHKKDNTIIIRYNNLKTGYIYNKTSFEGIEIEAVEAYNSHHDINACVGYILRFDGLNIYVAGDTDLTNDMQNKISKYNIDYAFLPVDGIYNMDVSDALKCANIINAKHTIPYHTDPESVFNMNIAQQFKHKSSLIVKNNEKIEL